MTLQPLESSDITCPYCGETITTVIDTSVDEQEYTEDCPVCCAPVLYHVRIDHDSEQIDVTVQKENE